MMNLNWTDHSFTPLDAEIEQLDTRGGRPRKIGDLVSSVRRDKLSKIFLVLGDPGSGKSVAMRHLARLMLDEINETGRLPIYVNLKEWADSNKIIQGAQLDIFEFIAQNMIENGNDLIVDFSTQYLRQMLEFGRLFIIFDSFDEIPVLLDQDDTSKTINDISAIIEEFIIGPHRSRCLIASRYFRKPRLASTEVCTLEILPLSDRKVRSLFAKTGNLSQTQIDQFFRAQSMWTSLAQNPFVASLDS